jgi:Na+/melibiose symporter-like transporter
VGGLFVAPVIERDQIGTPVSFLIFVTMYRVPGSVFVVWLSAVSGWAIDEDYHKSLRKNGQAKRREASWAGLRLFARGMGQTIGFLIIGSVMGLGSLFPAKCNSEIAAKDQDMACPRAIHFLWTWLNPIFLFLIGISGFMYPIHGQRLIDLINMQGTTQILRPVTKAARVAG